MMKSQFNLKIRNLKESKTGRTIDVLLGSFLLAYALTVDKYSLIAFVAGMIILTAGLFNICWLAPVLGTRFKAKNGKTYSYFIQALLFFILSVWLIGAYQAGTFIFDRNQYATDIKLERVEAFSQNKKYIRINDVDVAYIDTGSGEPVILLHGCPFQSYEWSKVIPAFSENHRVIAPDLLGLGDTRVKMNGDYYLPAQMQMVVDLMDRLGIEKAHFVGHDQGGAILQMLMKYHPERIRSAVLTNAEAYHNWPSEEEKPYLKLIVNPITSPLLRLALEHEFIQKEILGLAVADKKSLTPDVLHAFLRQHMQTPKRWRRLRRYYEIQLDEKNQMETIKSLDGIRRFNKPTLLVWGIADKNFGLQTAEKLAWDIPGYIRTVKLKKSAHLPMLEEPVAYARAVLAFWDELE